MEEVDTPIVGFRCWLVELEKPILKSVAMMTTWPVRQEFKAECQTEQGKQDPTHITPAGESCRCGIYSRTTLIGVREEYGYYPCHGSGYWGASPVQQFMTMGVILQWGKVLRGDKVIRSEYAQILCLTELKDLWNPRVGINDPSTVTQEQRERRSATIQMIQENYDLPMIPFDSVLVYSAEFGQLATKKE